MKFKNILLYAALLSGMSFSSCTDFLDEDSNPNALSPGTVSYTHLTLPTSDLV